MRVNIANLITCLRLAFLPFLISWIWPGRPSPTWALAAAVLYAACALLDMVDGLVARHFRQVTLWGKFFDPLVDKILHLTMLIFLLEVPGFGLPAWAVALMVTRELGITFLRAVAASQGRIMAASAGGKTKTLLSSIGMCALLIHYSYRFGELRVDFHQLGLCFSYLSLIMSLLSFGQYSWHYWRACD